MNDLTLKDMSRIMPNNERAQPLEIEEFDYKDMTPDLSAAPPVTSMAADDALASCVNAYGCVHLTWMSSHSGLSIDALADTLGGSGAIFQLPEAYDAHHDPAADWVLRCSYLNGNVLEKLATARRMNRKYSGRFAVNVHALENALPERVPFEEIGLQIGTPLISPSEYALFAKEVFKLDQTPDVSHSLLVSSSWTVSRGTRLTWNYCDSVECTTIYGTKRMDALGIFEHCLNGQIAEVRNKVSRNDRACGYAYVIDKEATIAAQEKQEAQQKAFQEWCAADPGRRKQIEERYNSAYVRRPVDSYDGSFLRLADLNPDVHLYPHQRNAAARIVLTDSVLLCWSVGTGKTYAMITGVHELHRIGLSRNNMVVVPNVMVGFFESSHHKLFPADRILVISPEVFRPRNRQHVLEQVRDGNFVCVYIAYSCFDQIHMSRDYYLDKKQKEIDAYDKRARNAPDQSIRRRLEKMSIRATKELMTMKQSLPEDEYFPFDALNVTALAIDEIHNYKNISVKTRAQHVIGLHTQGSRKCDGMLEKVRYVRAHGGRLVCSTATPLTNSIADLFVMQTYLQPEQLRLLGLSFFDDWRANFVCQQSGFEVDVDSQSFRIVTRPSRFYNLPELSSLFSTVCDFYNGSKSGMGLPACDGYLDVTVAQSPEQSEYLKLLMRRTEMVRQKLVSAEEDNLLKITNDGRKIALDIRLADSDAVPDPKRTKTYACAEKIYEIYVKYPDTAQLVFCDLGVPKDTFNIYDELRHHLVSLGIPMNRIAFIQDATTTAARTKLFAAVNRADIQVLIGSTSGLGTGVNVQSKCIAVHHLDIPWRPADLMQRDGRLIRQGNENRRVYRFRYVTAGTFDSYSWQLLENKERFIGQFLNHCLGDRQARDLDDTVLSYAEIKALCVGNPLLKTRIETANKLERVRISCRQRDQELYRLNSIIRSAPSTKKELQTKMRRIREDQALFEASRIKLDKKKREAFGTRLLRALSANIMRPGERRFETLHGFTVLLPAYMTSDRPYIMLTGSSGIRYTVQMNHARPSGCAQRIEYSLSHLGERISSVNQELSRTIREEKQAQKETAKGNPFAEEVRTLTAELLDIDEELNRQAEDTKRKEDQI